MNITSVLYAVLALGGVGAAFGMALSFAAKKFHVPVDDRIERLREALPGANCGACGFAGCGAYAQALVEDGAKSNLCTPGGKKTAEKIGSILNVEVDFHEDKRVAKVICQGEVGVSKHRYDYVGYPSCQMASSMSGGPKKCPYACIGLGDCERVCAFDAIRIVNGLARIDYDKCTACGACEAICPRHSIQLRAQNESVIVKCQNRDVARSAREECMTACIACKRCVKECKVDAIKVEDGYARIDPDKCTRCGDCAKVCPCKCIVVNA